MKKALLYLFLFIFIQFFVQWAVFAAWMLASGDGVDAVMRAFGGGNMSAITPPMLVAASAASSAAAIALFAWRRFAPMSPAYLRTRPWGVFFWCAVASIGTIIPSAGLQELLPALPDLSGDTFKVVMDNDYGYFVLCLLVPFAEEVVFRGAILRALLEKMKSHWAAIAVSALVFSVAHGNPAQMPHALLVGLLLGWMYYRTGSILPGVALHWVNNTAAYAIYILFPHSADMQLSDMFGGNTNNVVLAVVFSLFILLPAIYQLNIWMKRADAPRIK